MARACHGQPSAATPLSALWFRLLECFSQSGNASLRSQPVCLADDVEKIPASLILDFKDPQIGIEFDLAR
jgi:hypothetical protein